MNLDDLSDFVLVASNGGFAQASRKSGRPKASLSRKVMELEASIGVRLFERSSRMTRLTEEGELLLTITSGPLNEIADGIEMLREGRAELRGLLRVNVPELFGMMFMGRIAAEFTFAYPEVKLELTITDREVDLIAEGYDVVVRARPKPDSELVGICFLKDERVVVAAPSLPCPSENLPPNADRPVPVIVRRAAANKALWKLTGPPDREFITKAVLELPNLMLIHDAVLTGIGAARLPRPLVSDDLAAGSLVFWGSQPAAPVEIWALHTSRRFANGKIRAFLQFLKTSFESYS